MAVLTGITNKRFDAASLAALLLKIKAAHDTIMGATNPAQGTEGEEGYVPAEVREYASLIELERAIKAVAAGASEDLATLLDSSVAGEAGKFVKNISFTDSEIKADLQGLDSADKTIVINEYDLSVNIDGVTLQKDATSGKISVVKNAVVSLVELNETELAALGEDNVQTAYKLIAVGDESRTKIGDLIKVAKDSSVKDVHIGVEADGEDAQKLYLTYVLADGSESEVAVDFSSFIAEAEMGDGLKVLDDHKITIKIDENSEAFLTVGANGLKLDGVQDAIDTAKDEAIATVLGELNEAQGTEGEEGYVPAETREYNTLIEAERAIEALRAEKAALQDVIDSFNNAMTAADIDAAWTAAGL